MTSERRCNTCNHFSPALTCIERPTWGHCLRLLKSPSGGSPAGKSRFTWADSTCDNHQPRPKAVKQR